MSDGFRDALLKVLLGDDSATSGKLGTLKPPGASYLQPVSDSTNTRRGSASTGTPRRAVTRKVVPGRSEEMEVNRAAFERDKNKTFGVRVGKSRGKPRLPKLRIPKGYKP